MAESKHTPGPWSAFIDRKSKTIAVDIGPVAHGKRPNIVNWPGFEGCDLPFARQVANARLIAAAPEMLDALIAAWQALTYLGATLHAERCRAVIAKATQQEAPRG